MMILSTRSLPGSGTIKLSEIKAEFGKGNNLLNYLGEGGVTSSAPLKLTDFYGASGVDFDSNQSLPTGSNAEVSGQGGVTGGISDGSNWDCTASGMLYQWGKAQYQNTNFRWEPNQLYRVDYDVTIFSATDQLATWRLGWADKIYNGFDNNIKTYGNGVIDLVEASQAFASIGRGDGYWRFNEGQWEQVWVNNEGTLRISGGTNFQTSRSLGNYYLTTEFQGTGPAGIDASPTSSVIVHKFTIKKL